MFMVFWHLSLVYNTFITSLLIDWMIPTDHKCCFGDALALTVNSLPNISLPLTRTRHYSVLVNIYSSTRTQLHPIRLFLHLVAFNTSFSTLSQPFLIWGRFIWCIIHPVNPQKSFHSWPLRLFWDVLRWFDGKMAVSTSFTRFLLRIIKPLWLPSVAGEGSMISSSRHRQQSWTSRNRRWEMFNTVDAHPGWHTGSEI